MCPCCSGTNSSLPCQNCMGYSIPINAPKAYTDLLQERNDALVKAWLADDKLKVLIKQLKERTFVGEGI